MPRFKDAVKNPFCALLLLLLALVLVAQVIKVDAAPDATVVIGPLSLYPNGTGNSHVTVSGITGRLGSYQISITFDPSVVHVLDVLRGEEDISSESIDNIIGNVRFNLFLAQGPPKPTVTIAYLRVQAVGSIGSSSRLDIDTTYSKFYDASGPEIKYSPVSGSVTIVAPKYSSGISVSLDKKEVRIGGSVTVSGSISPAHIASVTLTFTRPDGSRTSGTVSSSTSGSYAYVFTPDVAGLWSVVASWPGDYDHDGASSSTATFNVTRFSSSISVILSPYVVEADEIVRIEGSITPSHIGASVELKYRVRGGEWTRIAQIATNATGGFSYIWDARPTTPGRYDVKASWGGDRDHEGVESLPATFYIAERSSLSIYLSSNSTFVDGTMVIRGQISPIHAYANVTISIKAPNGTELTETVRTDATGNYKERFVPDDVGTWRLKSSWQGDIDTLGSESSSIRLKVTSDGSKISLQTNASLIIVGNSLAFSGQIKPSPGASTAILTLTAPNYTLITLHIVTNEEGDFQLSCTPEQAGIWLAEASWPGNPDYSGSASEQISFAVCKLASEITLSLSPPIPKIGDLVTLEGSLNLSTQASLVKILMSTDEGKTWSIFTSLQTDAKGKYSTYWRADRIGTYMFKAEWSGNETFSGSVSRALMLAIQEEVITQTVELIDGNITQIVLGTNSSVLNLSVDAANGKIEANVTGPDGTTGMISIFIPSELLNIYNKSMEDLVFTVDSRPVSPDIVEVFGGYLATVRYNHSSRAVSIYYLTYPLEVTVTTYQGQKLEGATVFITGPIRTTATTNSSGLAYFAAIPKGNYTILVHYGPMVGEGSVNMTKPITLGMTTDVGKIEAEYADLQAKYQSAEAKGETLTAELNLIRSLVYLFVATSIGLVFATSYFMKKRKTRLTVLPFYVTSNHPQIKTDRKPSNPPRGPWIFPGVIAYQVSR